MAVREAKQTHFVHDMINVLKGRYLLESTEPLICSFASSDLLLLSIQLNYCFRQDMTVVATIKKYS